MKERYRGASAPSRIVREIHRLLTSDERGGNTSGHYVVREFRGIHSAALIALAPDTSERWRLDIVYRPMPNRLIAEVTLWHDYSNVRDVMTPREVECVTVVDDRASGGIWEALNRVQGLINTSALTAIVTCNPEIIDDEPVPRSA